MCDYNSGFCKRIARGTSIGPARIDHLLTWLTDCSPDVVCLQEIKCMDDAFPRLEIEALGYNVVTHGQKTFNASRCCPSCRSRRPIGSRRDDEDAHARFLEGVVP